MDKLKCFKCEHTWEPRTDNPRCCPKCRNRNWNVNGFAKCEICERNFMILQLHHIDKNHQNNNKNNLIEICIDCHSTIHSGFNGKKGKSRKYILEKNADAVWE